MKTTDALLRHRFLLVLTGALIAVLVVAMVNNLNIGARSAAEAEAVCAIILTIGGMAYLRGGARKVLPLLILSINVAIIHLLYITLRGGSLAGAYSLSVTFPVVAGYFMPGRRYLVWSGLFALSLVAHVLIASSGLMASGLTWPNLIRILIVYILVVYITKGDRWMTALFTQSVQDEVVTQTELASKLRREVEVVKETERAKSLFVSLASHQLRSPLTALRWSLEAYIHEAKKLSPTEQLMIDSAHDSTIRLIHLVTELLNVSRVESGRLRVVPVKTKMHDLVASAVTDLRPLAAVKNIQLDIELPKTPIILNIDPVLISQVLINFLSNAIKYSPTHQRVTLTVSSGSREVRVEVADHGLGIPLGEQPKVFQQMFRASNAQRVDEGGSGLGLFLAKSIIELSGGQIGFASEEAAGSIFWFTLPFSGSQPKAGEIGYEKIVPV